MISTHVLDTARGEPAEGIVVELYRGEALLAAAQTDADGRVAELSPDALENGTYRLVFHPPSAFFRRVELEIAIDDPEVLTFIAGRVSANIRELEGALTRVVAFSSLTDRPLTVELAEDVLRDVYPQGEAAPEVTIPRIQEAVSQRFGVTLDELVSPRRSQAVAYPRQVAMYLSRELTDSSPSVVSSTALRTRGSSRS